MSGHRLLRAFGQISGLTLISRLLGFVRDICFAHFIGAGPASDAFLVAFKLPNLFRRLTAEGALTNAFLPAYSLAREHDGKGRALVLAAEVQSALLLALCVLVIFMEVFMPLVVALLAPGFADTPARLDAAVSLARVTMPYLVMISLVALWSALLNSADDFISPATAPIILNLFLIGGAVLVPFSAARTGLGAEMIALPLAVGLLLAGVCQMLLLQYRLGMKKLRPGWRLGLSSKARALWHSFVPAALGAGATQINLLVDLILASWLEVGAISWLYYADRIAQLPLGLVGVALGTALLPRLSKIEAGKGPARYAAFSTELTAGFIPAACLVLPAAMGIIVIAEPLISGLFRTGAFDQHDARAAAAALVAYGVGLPAFVGLKLVQAGLYAMGKTRFVMVISVATVALNIVLSLILMQVFGHVGLALATSIVSWLAFTCQTLWLVHAGRLDSRPLYGVFLSFICAALMGLYLYLAAPALAVNFSSDRLVMACLVISGAGLYLGLGWLTGLLKLAFFTARRKKELE